jgi:hypothetical protein
MRLGLATEGRECCSWLAGQMKNNGVVLLTIRIIWRFKKMQVDDGDDCLVPRGGRKSHTSLPTQIR